MLRDALFQFSAKISYGKEIEKTHFQIKKTITQRYSITKHFSGNFT